MYNQANDMRGRLDSLMNLPEMLDNNCGQGGGGSGGGGGGPRPGGVGDGGVDAGSVINPVSGHYQDYVEDMQAAFGKLSAVVGRSFKRQGPWELTNFGDRLTGGERDAVYEGGLTVITGGDVAYYGDLKRVVDSSWTIRKNTIEYSCGGALPASGAVPDGATGKNYIFNNGAYTIETFGGYYDVNKNAADPFHFGEYFHFGGFIWKDPHGLWKKYDTSGRLVEYGSGDPATARKITLVWTDGKLSEIKGPDGVKVFGYEYAGGSARPTAVVQFDNTGAEAARVTYVWTGDNLTRVTDVTGGQWNYTYDGKLRITQKTVPGGRRYTLAYDVYDSVEQEDFMMLAGDPLDWVLVHRLILSYEYDSVLQEYRTTVNRTGSAEVELVYDRKGNLKERYVDGVLMERITTDTVKRQKIVRDSQGNITVEKFTDFGAPSSVTFPDSSTLAMRYSSNYLRPIEVLNRGGVATRFEYDGAGRVLRTIQGANTALSRTTSNTYNANGDRTVIQEPGGAETTKTYDAAGRVTGITAPMNRAGTYTYDGAGRLTGATDPRGNTTTYGYDTAGRQVRVTRPAAQSVNLVTEVGYDAFGNRTRLANPDGTVYTMAYDARNRLLSLNREDTGEALMTYQYDDANQKVFRIGALGRVRTDTFDGFGRLALVDDGAGNLVSYEYGAGEGGCQGCGGGFGGKPTRVVQPGGLVTSMLWNWEGNLTRQERLGGGLSLVRIWEYDSMGRMAQATDGENRVVRYGYDSLGRLSSRENGAGDTALVAYDVRDNAASYTDEEGRTTTFTHDLGNRLTGWANPLGKGPVYTYDGNDNLLTETNARGALITYAYDMANRVTGYTSPEKTVTFAWTGYGLLSSYGDATVAGGRTYDYLHHPVTESAVIQLPSGGSASGGSTTVVNPDGTLAAQAGPDGLTDTFAFDGAGKVTTITLGGGAGAITYTCTWDKVTAVSWPNGVTAGFLHDSLWRPTAATVAKGGGTLLGLGYGFDQEDNLVSLAVSGESAPRGYTYDAAERLVSASSDAGVLTFAYDKTGNRTSRSGAAGTWTYNAAHQLLSAGADTWQWDNDGNLTRRVKGGAALDFVFDSENRLAEVKQGGATVAAYKYDPFGRRILKTVGTDGYAYLWREDLLVAEWKNGTLHRVYGYLPGAVAGDAPVYMRTPQDGRVYFVHADHLGRPWVLTDADGNAAWRADYGPFEATVTLETVEFNFRMPGQYFDAETGLCYNRDRYYEPETGRYISHDPLGVGLAASNPYVYADGNPLSRKDPLGRSVTVNNVEERNPLSDLLPDQSEAMEFLADILCNGKNPRRAFRSFIRNKLGKLKWGATADVNWDNPLNPCVSMGINGWPVTSVNVSFSGRAYAALALCNAMGGW
jgi:RHS repeat-associated protein